MAGQALLLGQTGQAFCLLAAPLLGQGGLGRREVLVGRGQFGIPLGQQLVHAGGHRLGLQAEVAGLEGLLLHLRLEAGHLGGDGLHAVQRGGLLLDGPGHHLAGHERLQRPVAHDDAAQGALLAARHVGLDGALPDVGAQSAGLRLVGIDAAAHLSDAEDQVLVLRVELLVDQSRFVEVVEGGGAFGGGLLLGPAGLLHLLLAGRARRSGGGQHHEGDEQGRPETGEPRRGGHWGHAMAGTELSTGFPSNHRHAGRADEGEPEARRSPPGLRRAGGGRHTSRWSTSQKPPAAGIIPSRWTRLPWVAPVR